MSDTLKDMHEDGIEMAEAAYFKLVVKKLLFQALRVPALGYLNTSSIFRRLLFAVTNNAKPEFAVTKETSEIFNDFAPWRYQTHTATVTFNYTKLGVYTIVTAAAKTIVVFSFPRTDGGVEISFSFSHNSLTFNCTATIPSRYTVVDDGSVTLPSNLNLPSSFNVTCPTFGGTVVDADTIAVASVVSSGAMTTVVYPGSGAADNVSVESFKRSSMIRDKYFKATFTNTVKHYGRIEAIPPYPQRVSPTIMYSTNNDMGWGSGYGFLFPSSGNWLPITLTVNGVNKSISNGITGITGIALSVYPAAQSTTGILSADSTERMLLNVIARSNELANFNATSTGPVVALSTNPNDPVRSGGGTFRKVFDTDLIYSGAVFTADGKKAIVTVDKSAGYTLPIPLISGPNQTATKALAIVDFTTRSNITLTPVMLTYVQKTQLSDQVGYDSRSIPGFICSGPPTALVCTQTVGSGDRFQDFGGEDTVTQVHVRGLGINPDGSQNCLFSKITTVTSRSRLQDITGGFLSNTTNLGVPVTESGSYSSAETALNYATSDFEISYNGWTWGLTAMPVTDSESLTTTSYNGFATLVLTTVAASNTTHAYNFEVVAFDPVFDIAVVALTDTKVVSVSASTNGISSVNTGTTTAPKITYYVIVAGVLVHSEEIIHPASDLVSTAQIAAVPAFPASPTNSAAPAASYFGSPGSNTKVHGYISVNPEEDSAVISLSSVRTFNAVNYPIGRSLVLTKVPSQPIEVRDITSLVSSNAMLSKINWIPST